MYIEKIAVEQLVILRNNGNLNLEKQLKTLFAGPGIINSSGTVFITDEGMKLEGIITAGDYRRFLKTGHMVINKNCRRVLKKEDIFNDLYEIGSQYPNIAIVPVVDEDNVILGAYRLKPHYTLSTVSFMKLNIMVMSYPELIRRYFSKWDTIFLCAKDGQTLCMTGNILEKVIETEKIRYVLYDEGAMDWLLQMYGERVMMYYEMGDTKEALEIILEPDIVKEDSVTLSQVLDQVTTIRINENEIAFYNKEMFPAELISTLKKYDVTCKYVGIPAAPDLKRNVKQYYDLDNKTRIYMNTESPAPEQKKDFAELSNVSIIYKDGMLKIADCNSRLINFNNGRRFVPNQSNKSRNTIFVIGPCVARGSHCDDSHTIGAYLRRLLPDEFRIELCGGVRSRGNYLKWLGEIKVRAGDYILFVDEKGYLPKCDLDMTEAFKELFDREGQFFCDSPIHCNYLGNECIADAIYKEFFMSLKSVREAAETSKPCRMKEFALQRRMPYEGNQELSDYKDMLKSRKADVKGRAGAIVMNCNPFTLGHRYLIENALQQVDFLYIFVVQEDKSYFKFEDRIRLVKEGTADLDNVLVIPSGKFIISVDTFSEYFTKGTAEHVKVDTSLDVEIFARHIAPVLDIQVRFVGEEPFDEVTRQYNESMLDILPDYGIEVRVIPRKDVDGEVISASRVRRLLKEEPVDFEAIGRMVPESTLSYLKGVD